MIEAFPLQWPNGWPRTESHRRQRARFDTPFTCTRDNLLNEIRLLGGKSVVISSNLPLKRDGLPYANFRTPDDVGIAVYFELNKNQQCIPCDKWTSINDNLHAIELSIKALRGLERWGAKEMVNAAFRGFEALPPHGEFEDTVKAENKVDYFAGCETPSEVKSRRRSLSRDLHPDKGGDSNEFSEMMKQFDKKMRVVW